MGDIDLDTELVYLSEARFVKFQIDWGKQLLK